MQNIACSAVVALVLFMATRSKELRKVAEKFLDFLRKATPAACVVALWFVFRKRASGAWLRRLVAVGGVPSAVELLCTSLGPAEEDAEVDVIALSAMALGLLLRHNAAAVTILLMVTGGEALEEWAVRRAGVSLEALRAAAPDTAWRVAPPPREDDVRFVDEATTIEEIYSWIEASRLTSTQVAVSELSPGDLVLVHANQVVPADGRLVLSGSGKISDELLSGEAKPSSIQPGGAVLQGSVVLSSSMLVRVERLAVESAVVLMSTQLASAIHRKANIQKLSLRGARLFTPCTFIFSAISMWPVRASGRAAWERCLAVLMAATSCPMTIGVPVAFIGGISVAATWGITVKSAVALEKAASVTACVLDKTGTLTNGEPSVVRFVWTGSQPAVLRTTLLRATGRLEQFSEHPLGRAIREWIAEYDVQNTDVEKLGAVDVEEVNGRGVTGMVALHGGNRRSRMSVGTLDFVTESHSPQSSKTPSPEAEWQHHTSAFVAVEGEVFGVFYFDDLVKEEAIILVRQLQADDVLIVVLSGDTSGRLEVVATELGIADYDTCLPHEKALKVAELKSQGHTVLAIGDGHNDSALLAEADCGISLSAQGLIGSSADVVVLDGSLKRCVHFLRLSRQKRSVRRNDRFHDADGSGRAWSLVASAFSGASRGGRPGQHRLLNGQCADVQGGYRQSPGRRTAFKNCSGLCVPTASSSVHSATSEYRGGQFSCTTRVRCSPAPTSGPRAGSVNLCRSLACALLP